MPLTFPRAATGTVPVRTPEPKIRGTCGSSGSLPPGSRLYSRNRFPPRLERTVRNAATGRYRESVSPRSRSTKRTEPCVGYWGRSCIRADSRSTLALMSMITSPAGGFRRAPRSFRLERLDQPPDHGVEGSGRPGLHPVLDDLAVDVVDFRTAARLDVLEHGRLVVAGVPDVVDAVRVVVRSQGDLVGTGYGDPLLDEGIDQAEENGVVDNLGHRLSRHGTQGVHAGVENGLPPDQVEDLVGMPGLQPAPGEHLADPEGRVPGRGVQ